MKYQTSYFISLVVFLVSLSITGIMWLSARQTLRVEEEARFIQETQEIEDAIKYRLDDYGEALFGLRSLFATVVDLSRQSWNAYCESLELRNRIPGMLSLHFDTRITPTEQTEFIEKVNADTSGLPLGFPSFTIFSVPPDSDVQETPPEELYIVTYIWPWERYKDLYGQNMSSVPERRHTIETARDSGSPAITSKISSVLGHRSQKSGFVMYLPVYLYGAPTSTVEERRSVIQGVVEARFDAHTLIEQALHQIKRHPQIDVDVFDGTTLTPEHLYYNDDEQIQAQQRNSLPGYTKTVTLDIYGRPWTIFVSSKSGFRLATPEIFLPWIALFTGIIISFLLTGTILALTTSQIRAVQIAERMTRELENQRSLSMRSDRLRSLGEMAAGIAHELNQPLVGVRGLAEHILIAQDRNWNLDAQAIRKKVSTIIEQADRMAHIIEHIRIFAREAGKPELRPVNVNDVVTSGTSLIGAQFTSHGLRLEQELAPELPDVQVNPFTLEEVILNLLTNARDAVEERLQAEPDLHASGVSLRTYTLKEDERTLVKIDVIDNGNGIPEAIRKKIFDPFFTTKSPDKGTGLGLAISKTIVEEFGGNLTIASEPGQTTATVILPGG